MEYECGCKTFIDTMRASLGYQIDYCPKHKAAPALYEALLTALGTITALDNGKEWLSEIYPVIQKALSKAEDKPDEK